MAHITIITGEYGVGKSEFTLHYALYLKNSLKRKVYIADADVINVYFRSREAVKLLNTEGIEVIGNVLGEEVNTDVPHFSPNFYHAIENENNHLIIDLAGSEVGLRIIPAFIKDLIKRNDNKYEFLYVLNINRLGNSDINEVKMSINSFENYSQLKFSGIVNNSHLMEYSSCDEYLQAQQIVKACDLSIDIKYTFINQGLKCNDLQGQVIDFDEVYLKKYK